MQEVSLSEGSEVADATYALVVDNLYDHGQAACVRTIALEEDDAADLDQLPL